MKYILQGILGIVMFIMPFITATILEFNDFVLSDEYMVIIYIYNMVIAACGVPVLVFALTKGEGM